MRTLRTALCVGVALSAGGTVRAQTAIDFPAADGYTVYAHLFAAATPARAVIVAFHQGAGSGRAEYGPIAPRLNALGFDVIAIDQRVGGDMFDGDNRTMKAFAERQHYCSAMADLQGALAFARRHAQGRPIVLWGSSYSAALVVRLAALDSAGVSAVLSFSPASGEAVAECRGEELSHRITVPVLVVRPASEMERQERVRQAELFRSQGHEFYVAAPGTHGSSTLVPERVGGSTDATWERVERFLLRLF